MASTWNPRVCMANNKIIANGSPQFPEIHTCKHLVLSFQHGFSYDFQLLWVYVSNPTKVRVKLVLRRCRTTSSVSEEIDSTNSEAQRNLEHAGRHGMDHLIQTSGRGRVTTTGKVVKAWICWLPFCLRPVFLPTNKQILNFKVYCACHLWFPQAFAGRMPSLNGQTTFILTQKKFRILIEHQVCRNKLLSSIIGFESMWPMPISGSSNPTSIFLLKQIPTTQVDMLLPQVSSKYKSEYQRFKRREHRPYWQFVWKFAYQQVRLRKGPGPSRFCKRPGRLCRSLLRLNNGTGYIWAAGHRGCFPYCITFFQRTSLGTNSGSAETCPAQLPYPAYNVQDA